MLLGRTWAVGPALVAGLATGGCGCGHRGAPDAGGPRLDAAADAPPDPPPPRDAGPDAEAPAEPGWVPMPGLPEGCTIERAERPEAAIALRWVPCVDDLAGCVQLEDPPRDVRWAFAGATGYHDGQRSYFHMVESDAEGRNVNALATSDPEVYAAWREPPFRPSSNSNCFVDSAGIGPAHDTFGIYSWKKNEWPREERVYWAPRSEIGARVEPAVTITDPVLGGRSASQLHASSEGVVALQLSGFVMFIDDARGRVLGPGPAPLAGQPQYPLSLLGDDVFWSSWGNRVRVAHASRDQETELFLEAAEGGDIHYFQADGTDMAWYAGYDQSEETREYARVELWTAPYTNDPATLEPRLVAPMPHGIEDALLGGGHWVYATWTGEDLFANELWIYDLADATRRHLVFPEGHQLVLVHLSGDELLVMGKTPERQGGTNRLFRIQIDAIPVVPE